LLPAALVVSLTLGCGEIEIPAESEPTAAHPANETPAKPAPRPQPNSAVKTDVKTNDEDERLIVPHQPLRPAQDPPPILGDLLETPPGQEDLNFYTSAPKPTIDEERVQSHGIRKLAGKHLTLYTDLPPGEEVDALPRVFDAAVPQWAEYFHVEPARVAEWKLWGYVMLDPEKFRAAGLFPDDLPDFPNGYQRGHEFWLYEQPSAYYRRHLMLHEGTHGAMYHWLAGAGPPWYSEGMAELFGTHQWKDGQLVTRTMPRSKDETPDWGRIKLIRDAFANDRALLLHEVLKLPPEAHRSNDAYAWSWAAAHFFDSHPRYQQAFRALTQDAKLPSVEFSTKFLTALKDDIATVQTEWQLFVGNCEYGYDVAANALAVKPTMPLTAAGAKVDVAANHAWQSSGIVLEAGKTYRITASGRYQLGQEPKPWWCEPGGVTIRYHDGQPLGMLLGAIRNDEQPEALTPLLKPQPLGLAREITPSRTGTLWLKINEYAGEWADNEGSLQVEIHEVK
jgi:hypothetical protein